VLCPDHPGHLHQACRLSVPGDGLDFRDYAPDPRGDPRHQQQRAPARRGLRHRRGRAFPDVGDLHRAHRARPSMTPGARVAAAIEVVAEIAARRRPAPDALKDWGIAHRFAGSGDRAAIAGLVYDTLRRRASAAYVMDDTARGIVLGMLALERKLDTEAIARLVDGSRYAPAALTDDERARLAADLKNAPAPIAGDYPEWLDASLARVF